MSKVFRELFNILSEVETVLLFFVTIILCFSQRHVEFEGQCETETRRNSQIDADVMV